VTAEEALGLESNLLLGGTHEVSLKKLEREPSTNTHSRNRFNFWVVGWNF
jgi:hypothetical protein